jgi:hypothetical protein
MQPVELASSSYGNALLVLRGEEGAVTVEAWWHEGQPLGILVIHSRIQMREDQPRDRCEVLGHCYMDAAFSDGFKAAEYYLRGYPEQAEAILRWWYAARLAPEVVPS